METVRILWSGLRGRTGREAQVAVRQMDDVRIVAGVTRELTGAMDFDLRVDEHIQWYGYNELKGDFFAKHQRDFDVIVDFSHAEQFDAILRFAMRTHVPLISGTSGLSRQQFMRLGNVAKRVSVFRGGNFRFEVKEFIDKAVGLAMSDNGDCVLNEKFYAGKSLPSETSKVIQRKIYEATGKRIDVFSSTPYTSESLICEWIFDTDATSISCKTTGFGELAHDVLRIAKVITTKSPGSVYCLDDIWDDLLLDANSH